MVLARFFTRVGITTLLVLAAAWALLNESSVALRSVGSADVGSIVIRPQSVGTSCQSPWTLIAWADSSHAVRTACIAAQVVGQQVVIQFRNTASNYIVTLQGTAVQVRAQLLALVGTSLVAFTPEEVAREVFDVQWMDADNYPVNDCGENMHWGLTMFSFWRQSHLPAGDHEPNDVDKCARLMISTQEVIRLTLEKLRQKGLAIMQNQKGTLVPVTAEMLMKNPTLRSQLAHAEEWVVSMAEVLMELQIKSGYRTPGEDAVNWLP